MKIRRPPNEAFDGFVVDQPEAAHQFDVVDAEVVCYPEEVVGGDETAFV